jgi:hypothetical protein
VRAGHILDAAQESNQRPLGSPGPDLTLCRLPNTPMVDLMCIMLLSRAICKRLPWALDQIDMPCDAWSE